MKKEKPSTKLCKFCQTEIPYAAKVCPNCRKKQGMALWLKIILVVLLVGFVGSVFADDESSSSNEKTQTEKQDVAVNEGQKDKNEDTKKYGINEVVRVGNVEYVVNSVNTSKTVGTEYFNKDAQEMYLIINVTIKNLENEPLYVSDSFFNLVKGEKTYSCDTDASIYNGENALIFEEINPDARLTGDVVFDVTQETIDAENLQLKVQTGVWGTETGFIHLK